MKQLEKRLLAKAKAKGAEGKMKIHASALTAWGV